MTGRWPIAVAGLLCGVVSFADAVRHVIGAFAAHHYVTAELVSAGAMAIVITCLIIVDTWPRQDRQNRSVPRDQD